MKQWSSREAVPSAGAWQVTQTRKIQIMQTPAEQGRKEQGSEYRGEEDFLELVMLNRASWASAVPSGSAAASTSVPSHSEKKVTIAGGRSPQSYTTVLVPWGSLWLQCLSTGVLLST